MKTYGEHFIYQEYFFVITVVAVLTAVGTNMAYKIKFLFGKECTNMYDKKVYSNRECLLSLLTSDNKVYENWTIKWQIETANSHYIPKDFPHTKSDD